MKEARGAKRRMKITPRELISIKPLHMEDTHCCHDNYLADVSSSFFAIYDGYRGQNAAAQCAAHLHVHLRRELQHVCSQQHVDQRRVSNAFRRAYSSVEKLFLLNSENERLHSTWTSVACRTRSGALTYELKTYVPAMHCLQDT